MRKNDALSGHYSNKTEQQDLENKKANMMSVPPPAIPAKPTKVEIPEALRSLMMAPSGGQPDDSRWENIFFILGFWRILILSLKPICTTKRYNLNSSFHNYKKNLKKKLHIF